LTECQKYTGTKLKDVCQYDKKKTAGIKLQDFCQYEDKKKPKEGIVHFISGVTHMEINVLFCSKLMFTNGKIIVYKFMIRFYSNLYFCPAYS
jgi:hypothetical protein